MLSLQNILNTEGQEFIDNLFNKEVIVCEKLNAATLSFKKKQTSEMDLNRKLTFYKGSGSNKKEITIADRVMTTFYASGVKYINNLSKLIIDRIPTNWTFVCKYFPSHQPSFINYSILPKNNLVLSCIITSNGTVIDDESDLKDWADLFDIACLEPVFKGYLSEYQKERLTEYIKDNSVTKDSFARFVITLLNPELKHSIYQNDGFDSPIDGFIFKFVSGDGYSKPVSAKLIDPYMSSIIQKNKSGKQYKDNTDVLISDFTIFMTGQNIDGIILTSKSDDERYLELFYRLFNRYIKYKKSQLEDFDVDTNDVVKESINIDFDVDMEKISNETTKKLLKDNPEYKSIFKTLLGSFKSKKPNDYKSIVMSPGVVRLFNDMVDKIQTKSTIGEEDSKLTFNSYLDTIRHKTIKDLDVEKESTEIKNLNPVENNVDKEFRDSTALSFADFKKREKEKDEKKETEKEVKSIEDMIKDLKKSITSIKNDVKEIKSDKKEDKEEKPNDKSDDKEDKEEKSDKEENKSDNKEEKSDNKSDDKEEDNKNNNKEDGEGDETPKGDDEGNEDSEGDDEGNESDEDTGENNEDNKDSGGDDEGDEKPKGNDKKSEGGLSGL